MEPYFKFDSNLSRFVHVIMQKPKQNHANLGPDDLLISNGFRLLSNSSKILAMCFGFGFVFPDCFFILGLRVHHYDVFPPSLHFGL